jgi:hypothetical protein
MLGVMAVLALHVWVMRRCLLKSRRPPSQSSAQTEAKRCVLFIEDWPSCNSSRCRGFHTCNHKGVTRRRANSTRCGALSGPREFSLPRNTRPIEFHLQRTGRHTRLLRMARGSCATLCRSHEAHSDVDCDGPPLRHGRLRRESANDGRTWPSRSSRSGRTSRRTGTTGPTWAFASGISRS